MKIFIIARGYPTDKNPLLGIFEFDQARALKKRGHEVIYVAIDLRSFRRKRKFGYNSFIKERINIEEISVPIGAVPRKILIWIGSYFTGSILKKVKKIYGQPDIIHAHFIDIASMVSNIIKPVDKYVITEHSSVINNYISNKQKKEYFNTYRKADALITVSKDLQKRIKDEIGIDSICINNMIDTSVFRYISKDKNDDIFRFVTVSSLTENKRVGLMIESFSKLISKYHINNVELHIIGDGIEKKNLYDMVSQLGLELKVSFHGILKRPEVKNIFDNSQCFVLTSKKETFGVACAEALLNGLPVVVTKCGGPEEFINEHNGIITDDNDLVENMYYIYNNVREYDGYYISNKARELFSEKFIISKIEKVYCDVIKCGK